LELEKFWKNISWNKDHENGYDNITIMKGKIFFGTQTLISFL
jgi:hypothetical protein